MWKQVWIALLYISYSSAECNKCQANHAACINSTSYYLCFGNDVPNTDVLYHCNDGFDCTDLNAICFQSSYQRSPSCADSSLCGKCAAHRNYLFACLSRTTFQMCYGAAKPTGQIGSCPAGYVCDGGSDTICVLEQNVKRITCDIDQNMKMPQITTSLPSSSVLLPKDITAPNSQNQGNSTLSPTEWCGRQRSLGLYPPASTDPLCRRYVHCYKSNGSIKGSEYTCPPETFFHIQQQKCDFSKPSYCT